jgi:hypothetical protein
MAENNFFIDDDWTRDEIQAELYRVNTLINHSCLDHNGDILKETVECQKWSDYQTALQKQRGALEGGGILKSKKRKSKKRKTNKKRKSKRRSRTTKRK